MAALGRRIGRKRELFLRLHGVENRIEENDELEEGEQRTEPWESSLGASRSKDARARRRARARLENSSCYNDKAMVISQADGPINPSKLTNDDKSNPAKSSVDRAARNKDCLRLPAIETSRKQSRPSSLSEPSSTRYSYHNNGESRNIRSTISAFHSHRSCIPRDSALKSADFPSVSPFSLNSIRPKKFGGYRPSSGVVLKNLSSGSESESVNEVNRELSSARKIGNSIATLELSSPESKVAAINEPIKKMPIMSARNDITGSILPNLLHSSRSLGNDNINRQISQDILNTLRSCIVEQVNHDGNMTKTCNELEKITRNAVKAVFNERARCDELVTKSCNEFQNEPKYEKMHNKRIEIPQNTSTLSARNFMSESAETSICNKRIHDDSIMKIYNEFRQIESDFKNKRNQIEETESYRCITPEIHRDDIKDQFTFNCLTNQSNFEVNASENINRNVLDTSKWNQLTNLYIQETVETPHLTERIHNDILEEALSSRASEPLESEGQSRSSCTGKIYLQKEELSSRRPQNNDIDTSDNCDREIVTKVPALALNSQDISYSTSADSREYSATRSLDPHALIRALSDVSLKRKRQEENVPRKREDFYRHGKNAIDASSTVSEFPAKGETWRVPRSSASDSPRKSRVPSRIPIRIYNSKTTSATSDKFSGYCKHPEKSNKNYEKAKFIDQDDVRSEVNESVVRQRSNVDSSYCQVKQDSSRMRSKNRDNKIKSGRFTSDNKGTKYKANDHEFESVPFSNPRSPQSTPFGDYAYDRMQCFSETRSGGCTPVFFNKIVYSGNRDYAKIDDDVRSDRSISQKSADTVDITSATESSRMFKNKKNQSSQVESLRNAEENVTWRTEDDCASINDEENPEDVKNKDYCSVCDEKQKELYLQTKEHFKLAIERTCDPSSPFTIQHHKLNPSSEIEKSAKKQQAGDDLEFNSDQLSFDPNLDVTKVTQSEKLTFQIRRKQELSRISSTFNLNCESKRKKKSQERFPFTISEASAALSTKYQNANDLFSDKNLDSTEETNNQLKEKTVHELQMHPSITRLATSGLEDTMADIVCCVVQEQKDVKAESSSKSRMKALVRIFASKLKRASKHPNDDKTWESTKVIYENRACQIDSKANSCSDLSMEETHKMNFDKSLSNPVNDYHIEKCSSMLVPSGHILKKTESLQAIAQKHPYRRYDRDDLWIQDIKDLSCDIKKDNTAQKKDEANNLQENSPKDPYSIFLVKDLQSNKLSESNIDHDVMISEHVAPSNAQSKQSIDQKIQSIVMPEEIEKDLTGCLCWRLCHIIAPSKYRSSIREQVSSSRTKRSGFLLWKRKK